MFGSMQAYGGAIACVAYDMPLDRFVNTAMVKCANRGCDVLLLCHVRPAYIYTQESFRICRLMMSALPCRASDRLGNPLERIIVQTPERASIVASATTTTNEEDEWATAMRLTSSLDTRENDLSILPNAKTITVGEEDRHDINRCVRSSVGLRMHEPYRMMC